MRKIFFFIIYACSDKEKYDLMKRGDFSLFSLNHSSYNNTEKVSTMKFHSSNSRISSETSKFPPKYYPNSSNNKESFNIDSKLRFLSISNPEHSNGDDSIYEKLLQNAKENENFIKYFESLIKLFDEKILCKNHYEENFICFIFNKFESLILFLETIIESKILDKNLKKKFKFNFFTKKFFEYIEKLIEGKLDELEKNEIITEDLGIIEYFNHFFNEIKDKLYEKNNEEIILILKNYLEELKNDIEKFYKNDDEKNNKNKYVDFNIEEIKNENENDKIKKEIETQTTYRIKYISPEDSHSQKSNIYSKNKNESDLKSQTETPKRSSESFKRKKCSTSFFTENTEKTIANRKNVSSNTNTISKSKISSNSNSKKNLSNNLNTNCSKSLLYRCGSNDNKNKCNNRYTGRSSIRYSILDLLQIKKQ